MPTLSETQQLAQEGRAAIAESLNFLDSLNSGLLGWDPNQQGTFWNPTQGGVGPYPPQANYLLVVLQTPLFNRIQRWLARYLYHVNAYAISAVDSLTDMVIGPGYTITADNATNQRRIDAWVEANNWHERVVEAYKTYLIDGEVFFRVFGDKVRFVDADFVYSDSPHEKNGIITEPEDYETVLGYRVARRNPWLGGGNGEQEEVSVHEMQHRKMCQPYESRGFSMLLAVYSQILKATQLLDNLCTTLDSQARIAIVRQHDATKEAVQTFRSNLTNSLPIAGRNPVGDNAPPRVDGTESYPAGSIVDNGIGTKLELTSGGLMADKYVEVLRAILRQVAARVGIPEALLSQDTDSIAAYTGQLVPNSHLIRAIKAKQDRWCRQDLQLLKLCGIPIQGVSINFVSPVIVNRKEEAELAELLLDKGLASRQTVAANFDITYEDELPIIKREARAAQAIADLVSPPIREETAAEGGTDKPQVPQETT